eukprot:358241-Chlamydomonas_euryale.AAC.1
MTAPRPASFLLHTASSASARSPSRSVSAANSTRTAMASSSAAGSLSPAAARSCQGSAGRSAAQSPPVLTTYAWASIPLCTHRVSKGE